jgi:hypothetical protein
MKPGELWHFAHSTGIIPCMFQLLKGTAVLSAWRDIIHFS